MTQRKRVKIEQTPNYIIYRYGYLNDARKKQEQLENEYGYEFDIYKEKFKGGYDYFIAEPIR